MLTAARRYAKYFANFAPTRNFEDEFVADHVENASLVEHNSRYYIIDIERKCAVICN